MEEVKKKWRMNKRIKKEEWGDVLFVNQGGRRLK